jgi:hypothetical protein
MLYTSVGMPKKITEKISEAIRVYSISNQPNMIIPLNNQTNITTVFGISSGIVVILLSDQ